MNASPSNSRETWAQSPLWWKVNLLARGLVWHDDIGREELLTIALPKGTADMPQSCTLMTGRHPAGEELRIRKLADARTVLELDDLQLEVSIANETESFEGELSTGIPLLGAVFPSGSWVATGIRVDGKVRTPLMSYDELEESLRFAKRVRNMQGVLLTSPSTDRRTGGVALLEPFITRIKQRLKLRVFVEVEPPKDASWIERAYAWGADGLFIPLKVSDQHNYGEYFRRAKIALEFAATVFPPGATATSLDLNTSNLDATLEIARNLLEAGVLPLFYYSGAQSRKDFESGLESVSNALNESKLVPDYWLQGLGHLVSPRQLRALTTGSDRSAITRFLATPTGSRIADLGGQMRRGLRVIDQFPHATSLGGVQEVEESKDSSNH